MMTDEMTAAEQYTERIYAAMIATEARRTDEEALRAAVVAAYRRLVNNKRNEEMVCE
jgi:hypothetical protein